MEGFEDVSGFTNSDAYVDLIEQFLKERDSKWNNDNNNSSEDANEGGDNGE